MAPAADPIEITTRPKAAKTKAKTAISAREQALFQWNRKLREDGKPQLGVRIDPLVNNELADFCMKNRRYNLNFATKEEFLEFVIKRGLKEFNVPERFSAFLEMEQAAFEEEQAA